MKFLGSGAPHRKVKAQSDSHLPITRNELATFDPLSHESLLVWEILPGMEWLRGQKQFCRKIRAVVVVVVVVAVSPFGVLLGKITIYLSLSDRHRLENGFSLGLQPARTTVSGNNPQEEEEEEEEGTALFNPERQSRAGRVQRTWHAV